MKNIVQLIIVTVCLLFALISCDGPCNSGFLDRTFPESIWASDLNNFVPMSSMRLNNFTASAGQYCDVIVPASCQNSQNSRSRSFCEGEEFQFKNPCTSYMNFGIARRQFDIIVPRVGPDSMIKIYINDINSSNISMDIRESRLHLEIDFESFGTEIVGACHNNFFCFVGTPKFELDNMKVDINFQLVMENNTISFNDLKVDVSADFANAGMCRDNVFAFLCGDQDETIRSSIETGIHNELLRNENRRLINSSLHAAIARSTSLETTTIRRISINNSNELVVNIPCNN